MEPKLEIRQLARSELGSIWKIDRSEFIDGYYVLREGKLVLMSEQFNLEGWPSGEEEHFGPHLVDCFDRGGAFIGALDGGTLVGIAVLESRFIGSGLDQLQLKFLHVGRPYRGRGLGTRLFQMAASKARELGARKLYISSNPSKHTVEYYMNLGCGLAEEINPELFELEPEDIHMEYVIPSERSMNKATPQTR